MCEQEGEWSHLCDTILLGDRQLWICMVWSCCLGAQYTASHWEEKGEEKDPCSSCCLVASLPPRKDPQAKVGNRFCHSKCSSYWIQHTQSQEHQLLLHLSLQKLYSTLLTRLSLWERERERGAFRHVLLLSLRGLVACGSGTQVCSEHSNVAKQLGSWGSFRRYLLLSTVFSSEIFNGGSGCFYSKGCLSQFLCYPALQSRPQAQLSPLVQYQWSSTSLFNMVAETGAGGEKPTHILLYELQHRQCIFHILFGLRKIMQEPCVETHSPLL